MAVYHAKENNLKNEYEALRNKSKKYSKYAIICLLAAIVLSAFGAPFAVFGVVGMVVCVALRASAGSKEGILLQGIEGEEETQRLLSSLPDTYHIIPNVEIIYEGKHSEMDNVIVGETGVFIVETKNKVGDILGEIDDHQWKQIKVSRKGYAYTDMFYNPTKQVATHVYRLSGHLKEKKHFVWVQGIVYFSNPGADVDITASDGNVRIPVFSATRRRVINKDQSIDVFRNNAKSQSEYVGEGDMLTYITGYGKQRLSREQVEKIVSLLL